MAIAEIPIRSDQTDPDTDDLYEIVDGIRLELPPMSIYSSLVANEIHNALVAYSVPRRLGRSVVETLFRLPLHSEQRRRPDVAFVTSTRWPAERPVSITANAWDVVPDLAVEVISPNDVVEELMEKLDDYFSAGVRSVWVVYPVQRRVQVYKSMDDIHGFGENDELDGGDILPGFRVNVGSLFPPRE